MLTHHNCLGHQSYELMRLTFLIVFTLLACSLALKSEIVFTSQTLMQRGDDVLIRSVKFVTSYIRPNFDVKGHIHGAVQLCLPMALVSGSAFIHRI